MKWMIALAAAVIVVLVVIACGGGSPDDRDVAQPPPLTGCGSFAQFFGTVQEIAVRVADQKEDSEHFTIIVNRDLYPQTTNIDLETHIPDISFSSKITKEDFSSAMCTTIEQIQSLLGTDALLVKDNAAAGSLYKNVRHILDIVHGDNFPSNLWFVIGVNRESSWYPRYQIWLNTGSVQEQYWLSDRNNPTATHVLLYGEGKSLEEAIQLFCAQVSGRFAGAITCQSEDALP